MQKRSATAPGTSANPAIAGFVAFIVAGAFIAGPRTTPFLLPALAAVPLTLAVVHGSGRLALPMSTLVRALMLFGVYLLINAAWSVVPALAYGKVALYFLIIAAVVLGTAALAATDTAVVERMARAILWTGAAFMVVLTIEVIFGLPIRRILLSLFPFLQPGSPKHITVTDGWVTHVGPHLLNRNVAAACLMIWPMALIARTILGPRRGLAAGLALLVLLTLTTAFSQHETSVLALVLSGTVFLIARYWPTLGLGLAGTGWAVATLLVVPMAMAAYTLDLHHAGWMPSTAQARIILWDYTAEQVLKRPLLGVGVQSTKPLDKARKKTALWPKGFVYPRRTGRHSHNIYMQTWYELGAVGAAFLLACGLLLLWQLRRLASDVQPYALAAFISAAVIGAFSWGLWQPWFMAAFGLSALMCALAIELAARRMSKENRL